MPIFLHYYFTIFYYFPFSVINSTTYITYNILQLLNNLTVILHFETTAALGFIKTAPLFTIIPYRNKDIASAPEDITSLER